MALSGDSITRDCRVSARGVEAFDLRIWASPFAWKNSSYAIVMATDISNEKRRKVLERIFFHDLLNVASGIYSIAELMDGGPKMDDDLKATLHSAAEALISEIKSQQTLLAAENHELGTSPTPLQSLEVIKSVIRQFRNHDAASGKTIVIAPETVNFDFISDHALLIRVLGNLLKNALEASGSGSTITLGARIEKAGNVFWCHNSGVMSSQVRFQVFQRSFSTKGAGRGIGTYSVRLLTERYLGGTVVFESLEPDGTTFRITLPPSEVIGKSA
jgi:signal transduction histidine kinase